MLGGPGFRSIVRPIGGSWLSAATCVGTPQTWLEDIIPHPIGVGPPGKKIQAHSFEPEGGSPEKDPKLVNQESGVSTPAQ